MTSIHAWRAAILALTLIVSTNVRAQVPDIVVQAERPEHPRIEPSRTTTVLTTEEIQRKGSPTVAELLSDVPGIEVVRQGGAGQTTSVFIRGARSEDTLVLIDGVEANDAMSPSSGYDFSSLSPNNISRIEVFRGPQSVRFGAGALGGVINIITKEGEKGTHASYSTEQGSYATNHSAIGVQGKASAWSYSAGLDRLQSQGFSAASERFGNTEADGIEVQSGSVKLIWQNNPEAAKVQGTFRYMKAKAALDRNGGPGGDAPNDESKSSQLITGLSASEYFLNQKLRSTIGLYFSEIERSTQTTSPDHFLSENKKAQSETELLLGDSHTLRLGLQWREETGAGTLLSRQSQAIGGESLTYLYETETWFADLGLRSDQSRQLRSILSSRASLGRNIPETKSKATLTFGSGFKLPSLYQLYSAYGDTHLRQEDSTTFDASFEQGLSPNLGMSLTYFQSEFKDLIDFNMTSSKYFNIARAQSHGLEAQAQMQLISGWKWTSSYTYLDAKDESSGLGLLRRPHQSAGTTLVWTNDKLELSADYRYRGARPDVDPVTFSRINNSAYDLVNLEAGWKISDPLRLHMRIENLFDRKYEEVAGYGTPGLSFYVGLAGEI